MSDVSAGMCKSISDILQRASENPSIENVADTHTWSFLIKELSSIGSRMLKKLKNPFSATALLVSTLCCSERKIIFSTFPKLLPILLKQLKGKWRESGSDCILRLCRGLYLGRPSNQMDRERINVEFSNASSQIFPISKKFIANIPISQFSLYNLEETLFILYQQIKPRIVNIVDSLFKLDKLFYERVILGIRFIKRIGKGDDRWSVNIYEIIKSIDNEVGMCFHNLDTKQIGHLLNSKKEREFLSELVQCCPTMIPNPKEFFPMLCRLSIHVDPQISQNASISLTKLMSRVEMRPYLLHEMLSFANSILDSDEQLRTLNVAIQMIKEWILLVKTRKNEEFSILGLSLEESELIEDYDPIIFEAIALSLLTFPTLETFELIKLLKQLDDSINKRNVTEQIEREEGLRLSGSKHAKLIARRKSQMISNRIKVVQLMKQSDIRLFDIISRYEIEIIQRTTYNRMSFLKPNDLAYALSMLPFASGSFLEPSLQRKLETQQDEDDSTFESLIINCTDSIRWDTALSELLFIIRKSNPNLAKHTLEFMKLRWKPLSYYNKLEIGGFQTITSAICSLEITTEIISNCIEMITSGIENLQNSAVFCLSRTLTNNFIEILSKIPSQTSEQLQLVTTFVRLFIERLPLEEFKKEKSTRKQIHKHIKTVADFLSVNQVSKSIIHLKMRYDYFLLVHAFISQLALAETPYKTDLRKTLFNFTGKFCAIGSQSQNQIKMDQELLSEFIKKMKKKRKTVKIDIDNALNATSFAALRTMAVLLDGPIFDPSPTGIVWKWLEKMLNSKDILHRNTGYLGVYNLFRNNQVRLLPIYLNRSVSLRGEPYALAVMSSITEGNEFEPEVLLDFLLCQLGSKSHYVRIAAVDLFHKIAPLFFQQEEIPFINAHLCTIHDRVKMIQFETSTNFARVIPRLATKMIFQASKTYWLIDSNEINARESVLNYMIPWLLRIKYDDSSASSITIFRRVLACIFKIMLKGKSNTEKLWWALSKKKNNLYGVVKFLISNGMGKEDSSYLQVAKKVLLYSLRTNPNIMSKYLISNDLFDFDAKDSIEIVKEELINEKAKIIFEPLLIKRDVILILISELISEFKEYIDIPSMLHLSLCSLDHPSGFVRYHAIVLISNLLTSFIMNNSELDIESISIADSLIERLSSLINEKHSADSMFQRTFIEFPILKNNSEEEFILTSLEIIQNIETVYPNLRSDLNKICVKIINPLGKIFNESHLHVISRSHHLIRNLELKETSDEIEIKLITWFSNFSKLESSENLISSKVMAEATLTLVKISNFNNKISPYLMWAGIGFLCSNVSGIFISGLKILSNNIQQDTDFQIPIPQDFQIPLSSGLSNESIQGLILNGLTNSDVPYLDIAMALGRQINSPIVSNELHVYDSLIGLMPYFMMNLDNKRRNHPLVEFSNNLAIEFQKINKLELSKLMIKLSEWRIIEVKKFVKNVSNLIISSLDYQLTRYSNLLIGTLLRGDKSITKQILILFEYIFIRGKIQVESNIKTEGIERFIDMVMKENLSDIAINVLRVIIKSIPFEKIPFEVPEHDDFIPSVTYTPTAVVLKRVMGEDNEDNKIWIKGFNKFPGIIIQTKEEEGEGGVINPKILERKETLLFKLNKTKSENKIEKQLINESALDSIEEPESTTNTNNESIDELLNVDETLEQEELRIMKQLEELEKKEKELYSKRTFFEGDTDTDTDDTFEYKSNTVSTQPIIIDSTTSESEDSMIENDINDIKENLSWMTNEDLEIINYQQQNTIPKAIAVKESKPIKEKVIEEENLFQDEGKFVEENLLQVEKVQDESDKQLNQSNLILKKLKSSQNLLKRYNSKPINFSNIQPLPEVPKAIIIPLNNTQKEEEDLESLSESSPEPMHIPMDEDMDSRIKLLEELELEVGENDSIVENESIGENDSGEIFYDGDDTSISSILAAMDDTDSGDDLDLNELQWEEPSGEVWNDWDDTD